MARSILQVSYLAVVVVCCLSLTGCGYSFFAAKTTASYRTPQGHELDYSSDKEQTDMEGFYNPETGEFRIKVGKAGAQESAVAASQNAMAALLQMNVRLLEILLPLIQKAAGGP